MKSVRKLFRAAILAGVVVSGSGCVTTVADNGGNDRLLNEIFNKAVAHHVSRPDPATLGDNRDIGALLAALDPHSAYFSPEEYRKMQQERLHGEFGGIGVDVAQDETGHLVKVISPIDGTPAARGGILPGDLITHIDGQSLEGLGLNEAISRIRGKPGTKVTLTVKRGNAEEPLEVKLTRDRIEIATVRGAVIGDDIGYVRISSFSGHTESALLAVMDQLKFELGGKARGYVIDLRNNPGGLLLQGVSVADDFLDSGTVVSVGRGDGRDQIYRAYKGDIANGRPVIVLVNEGSASAAEIVAGALQDQGRAIILGTRSFGKGSVQTIFPLSNGGALSLTTAHYFTPSGDSIQGRGITPDILFASAGTRETTARREADLENALTNPDRARDDRQTTATCGPAATPAAVIDADALLPGGEPDYQLLCAIDRLRETASHTATLPVQTPRPDGSR